MKFLGNIIATVIGIFVFIMLSFFGIVLIGAIFGGDDKVSVKADSVIELDLKNIQNDYAGKYKDPWVTVFSGQKGVGVTDVINAIEAAKKDEKIKGISILNDQSSLGLAQYKDLRNALESFKKSGKFVWAYANTYSQKEYYLNSVANTIYLNPAGDLDFKGLSSEVMFFKDFQEKSGIHMEVIRHGKYKSAVEPFLENKMSDANREQITALLNSLWSTVASDIAKSRNIPLPKLNEIANGLLARTPEMAKAQHLVDIVAYEDVYHNDIKKALKVTGDDDYNKISISDYTQNNVTTALTDISSDQIAIIYAQGEIESGEGDVTVIGEGAMRRSLQEARKNEDVKAIVLRIDSPGGSALTSDLIWREIEITKKIKPVVVSMGNYAASGGYYIACNANKIFAENNTITGSIGVFGVLPNFTSLATKLGVNTEQVKTHENAANYSPFVPVDEKFKAFTLEGVENIYKTFVMHVAEGRKMTFAQVDAIAQGRVWSGSEALKIGLVDKIGGLNDAIAEAAKIAKIKNYSTQNYPEYEKNLDDLLSNLSFAKSKEAFIKEEIGEENYILIEQIKRYQNKKGVQAMMPFGLKIQ
ncbi:signal peptide peptidase SppA [Flavobacterium sp. Fl-77]|uniref:Signal peptide peptidase SppA n=1 Tax=Flavobacterium flavipigmentatum TaxID=2893884 RepID=A0AAJ2SJ19_9FLAO|nr:MULTISPECIES: signal peptide peptidase SppA [unclassified Flavobacterium]MDX6183889.1 signal peptide peptidase SppA [Flavobacterium sp. Fl-33]MDX6187366.1 signal peptide peptidase SppA [Flavobacterium sp. Fl-77]UFH40270.1 signal peptide peptidase SppA [Flavobacterium sp. F-70]